LTVQASVPTESGPVRLPSGESFAWQVLSALTDEVSAEVNEGRAGIRLTKRRPAEA
jgi:serine/threonine-protein kinase RsbW